MSGVTYYYVVVLQEREDDGFVIKIMTGNQILELARTEPVDSFAIIDGEVIKDAGNKRLPRGLYK